MCMVMMPFLMCLLRGLAAGFNLGLLRGCVVIFHIRMLKQSDLFSQ